MKTDSPKMLLHAGCGPVGTPEGYDGYLVYRLDADKRHKPHFCCSMTDMHNVVETAKFDVVYCAHSLEHLHRNDVFLALAEFKRVLKVGGQVHLIVPDLQKAAQRIVDGNLEGPAYTSAAGVICAGDIVFGHSAQTQANPFMAHQWGFTKVSLQSKLLAAGFDDVRVVSQDWNIVAKGRKE